MVNDADFDALKKEVAANKLGQGVGYFLNRTGVGTTLNIKAGSASSSPPHPFKAITSITYTGEGTPPENQGLKFRVMNGYIIAPDFNTMMASNRNTDMLADDDCSDGFFCWAQVSFYTSETGEVTMTSFIYDSGTEVPDAEAGDPETGAAPANVYLPLFYLTTKDKVIDSATQLIKNCQSVSLEVTDITATQKKRQLSFHAI